MRCTLTILFLLIPWTAWTQNANQTENIILITLDGLRWQELYGGADASLIEDKDYVKNPAEGAILER